LFCQSRASANAKALDVPDLHSTWRKVLQIKALTLINIGASILSQPVSFNEVCVKKMADPRR
jgi:hypothetical protein